MGEFRMPSLGADMDSGTITQWLVQPGDAVHRGDIVAVVDTEKADVEVEVFEDGIVEELLVPAGARVEVGTPLARIGTASGASEQPAGEPRAPFRGEHTAPEAPATQWHAPESAAPSGGRPRVSPRAKRLATERGVDIARLAPSRPGGTVVGADIERAGAPANRTAEPVSPPPPARIADKAKGMRAAIARAMARSKREIPHYYLATDIDFSRAQAFLQQRNAARPVTERVLPAALLLKATAVGVRSTPELNGSWVDDALRISDAVHVGVAISMRGGGLVAPAIHDADERGLDDMMAALRDLVSRARSGSLRASEMSDPTITVTNLGEQGVQSVFGVIYPPQVALVGFGSITERAWAVDGMVGAHPIVTVTLAADHRASDGARGAQLLNVIDRLLQEPEAL
jgi:pyruvate dehydrogenase E2 component (dihydrolipoamide acetyltransferase)